MLLGCIEVPDPLKGSVEEEAIIRNVPDRSSISAFEGSSARTCAFPSNDPDRRRRQIPQRLGEENAGSRVRWREGVADECDFVGGGKLLEG